MGKVVCIRSAGFYIRIISHDYFFGWYIFYIGNGRLVKEE